MLTDIMLLLGYEQTVYGTILFLFTVFGSLFIILYTFKKLVWNRFIKKDTKKKQEKENQKQKKFGDWMKRQDKAVEYGTQIPYEEQIMYRVEKMIDDKISRFRAEVLQIVSSHEEKEFKKEEKKDYSFDIEKPEPKKTENYDIDDVKFH